MTAFISGIPEALTFVVLLAAAVGAVYTLWRQVIKPTLQFAAKVNSGMDALLGYPEVLDPGSGDQLKAATPPMAQRVAALEDAFNRILDLQESQLGLVERLTSLEQWKSAHTAESIQWRQEHNLLHNITTHQ